MRLCQSGIALQTEAFARADQAEGLRQMFARRGAVVLPVLAPGGGQGALVANLAAAMARSGHEVLVVDSTHGEVARAMGLTTRYELAHVVAGDKRLSDVVLAPLAGLRIVPAARALAHARNIDQWLAALAGELSPHPDLIVLHQAVPLAAFSGDWLVAASPQAETLTRTYSELKRMPRALAHGERGRLRLLVGRAADEHSARTLHRALDEASQRFLDASIDWAGYVPHDASLRRAEAIARPVFDIDLRAASALALMDMARALEGWDLPRVQPSRTAL